MSRQHTRAAITSQGRGQSVGRAGSNANAQPLLAMQRQVGNAQVARLIADAQRKPDDDKDELQAKREIQRQAGAAAEVGPEGGPISAGLSARIGALRSGGTPMAGPMRARMERSFGTSFADVRLHTGAEAAAVSQRIGALAFTTGSSIFFGNGASPTDTSLMAHELTHVVQQRGASPGGGPLSVGAVGDSHEQQAETTASQIAGNQASQGAH